MSGGPISEVDAQRALDQIAAIRRAREELRAKSRFSINVVGDGPHAAMMSAAHVLAMYAIERNEPLPERAREMLQAVLDRDAQHR